MVKFAVATKPAPVGKVVFRYVSYVLGCWSAVLAVAQMVSFEDFVEALRSYNLGSERLTVAVAVAVITLEVFAVPFLFRLSLSPAARFVSALFALLLPLAWTVLTVHAFLAGVSPRNAGYFGEFLPVHVGALALVLDLLWATAVVLSFDAIGGMKALQPGRGRS